MLTTKNFEIKKQSVSFTFESDDKQIHNLNRYEAVSIALLTGYYNPMRKYSDSDKPIDIKRLFELREKFNGLINEVISEMDVNVEDVEKVK